ncbi:uncharacterized protein LACBIDRAFT_314050 [Laccaria bicolor S238N-H82]|uniref:Predicted protein n=1 Tax=Laccaria bicolor (strain S238N-H82 / ATCC MYA-4686) TaxID=486041 RepID=B0D1G5_LACBS|nr:uncharacterized protein LACBIDRAFT_314050 [Laccaria bicolor S238N-H82]EDR11632.1 predicted protein [Laccaria bicolor S238N-H82]|eukprot:XP_001877529.1 predicted protein [Laccaria bicolor S238N-H82]
MTRDWWDFPPSNLGSEHFELSKALLNVWPWYSSTGMTRSGSPSSHAEIIRGGEQVMALI